MTRQLSPALVPARPGTSSIAAAGESTRDAPAPGVTAPPLARGTRGSLAFAVGGSVLALLVALVLALPYLAEQDVAAAASGWADDPARAFERLDRAAGLNPLSARPDLVAGVIALELRRSRAAREHFSQALERDSEDWFAWFGRGLAATALRDHAQARADYRRAHALDPAEPLVREALARLNGRDPLTAQEAFARLRRDVQRLSGSPRAQILPRSAA